MGIQFDAPYYKMWYLIMVEEYPRDQMELEAMFSTEESCRG